MKCKFIDPATGKQCGAFAVRQTSDGMCIFHTRDESIVERMREARSRAGQAGKRSRAPRTLADVQKLLSEMIARCACGEVSTSDVSSMKSLVQMYVKLHDIGVIQRRLDSLEADRDGKK